MKAVWNRVQPESITARRLRRYVLAVLVAGFVLIGGPVHAANPAIFTVTNTNDIGSGSLRQAILDANANPSLDAIVFDIPAATDDGCDALTGVCTIQPSSALPTIADSVVIDGYTQSGASLNTNGLGLGSNAVLKIELDGTNADSSDGLTITAGTSTLRGLVINRFRLGIKVEANGGNLVEGNFIGTSVDGTSDLGNSQFGLFIHAPNNTIGGVTPGARNIISGNRDGGILISSFSGNLVQGNFIGIDVTGTAAIPNSDFGVFVIEATNNTIGGTTTEARNIISGNSLDGVTIAGINAAGNLVQGNFIGTDVTGSTDLGNSQHGVRIQSSVSNTIGGTTAEARNIISGNDSTAVAVAGDSTANLVQGNFIGTDVTGTAALSNTAGVTITDRASGNTIGGTASGSGNTIAFNGGFGVGVFVSGTENAILSNSILSNTGLGIELFPDGATPNDLGDGDTGPNNLQNFPVLTSAATGGSVITGTLNSASNATFRIEFFSNSVCDPSNHGEGETFLGSEDVTTDGTGNAAFAFNSPTPLSPGQFITSTATDPNNNTSEFSQCILVQSGFVVSNTNDSGVGSLRQAILAANSKEGMDTIVFNIPGEGPHKIRPISALPTITDPVVIDGYTEPGAAHATSSTPTTLMIELDGHNAGADANGLIVTAGNSTIRGLAINRFTANGILVTGTDATGNVVEGNFIGTDAGGSVAPGNMNGVRLGEGATLNTIGGLTPEARNVISGNADSGVQIAGSGSTGNQVQGNFIGTDSNGTTALGNLDGVWLGEGAADNTIGGVTLGARNILSGNVLFGVSINNPGTTGNLIQGNYIGTDVSGNAALANNGGGVVLTQGASDNSVGGTESGAANTIAFNGGPGVKAHPDAGISNAIRANAIHENRGLGIDLRDDGVTPNDLLDADSGPNQLQNFPMISALFRSFIGSSTATLVFEGSLRSAPSTTFDIDLFGTRRCDPSGHGEGENFVGSTSATTDERGHATILETFSTLLTRGVFVTGTTTDPNGNTSEFSACAQTSFLILSGGLDITWDPFTPTGGDGPVIRITGDILGGDKTATLEVCGEAPLTISSADEIDLECGSARIVVVQGPIEIQLDDNTQAIVPTDATVIVETIVEGQLKLQNDSPEGTEPVLIAFEGVIIGEIDAGESLETSPRGLKVFALGALEDLRPQLNVEGEEKLVEALELLNESLFGELGDDEVLWLDDFHLNPDNGDDVFGTENDAVEKLMEILEKPDEFGASDDVVAKIVAIIEDQILEADRLLAQNAIDEAGSGDPDLLEEADSEMSEAASEIDDGHYDKAVERYFKAWEAALKSIAAL